MPRNYKISIIPTNECQGRKVGDILSGATVREHKHDRSIIVRIEPRHPNSTEIKKIINKMKFINRQQAIVVVKRIMNGDIEYDQRIHDPTTWICPCEESLARG